MMQTAGSQQYLVQTQNAATAVSDHYTHELDRETYENEHLAFELAHDLT